MSENEEKTTATAVKGSDKHVVPYKDFALEADTSSNEKVLRYADTSRVRNPFPVQLHCILSQLELDGLTDIAEWKPHGRCFTVHKQREFEDKVLNRWFRQTTITSFQRQLNIYGFTRLTAGPDKNCYYNEKFLRNKRFLSHQIRRTSIKGHGPRRPYAHLTNVPNFYTMPFLPVTVHEASPLPLPSKTKQDREPSRSAEDPPFSSLLGQYSEGGSYKSSAGDDLLLGTMQSTQHQSRSKPGLLGIASLLSTCMQRNGTNAHGNPSFPVGNERSVLPDASTPLQQLQRAYISRAQEQQQLDTLTKSIQHAFQQNSLQQQNPSFPGNGGWNTHTHPMMGGGGALAVGLLPTTAPNLSSLMALSIPTMAVPSHSATLSNNNWVFSNQVRGGGTSSFTAHPPPPPPPLFVTLTNNNVNNSIFGTNTNSSDDSSVRERILQLLHHQQQQQQQQQSPSIPFSFAGWF